MCCFAYSIAVKKEGMFFMKKLVSILMASVLLISISGCGQGKKTAKGEDPNTVPSDPYEIQWYIKYSPQKDVDLVEEELNKYLKDKINATVNMVMLDPGQYNDKVSTMIKAGENFDLAFASSSALDYLSSSVAGAFAPLTDYKDTYLKGIFDQLPKEMIEAVTVDGEIYAVPTYKEIVSQSGWIYRKDIAEKYNIDMSKYKTLEDFKPVAEMLKKNEPSIDYPVDWDKSYYCLYDMYYDPMMVCPLENLRALGIDDAAQGGDPTKIILSKDSKTNNGKRMYEAQRDYYKSGLVKGDVATASDLQARFNSGKTFAYYAGLKPGKAAEIQAQCKYPVAQAETTDIYMDSLPGIGSLQVISTTSKNPERTARFLNLLNTDPVVKNLVVYGIEGKHYKKVNSNTVEIIADSGYSMAGNTWALGNVFIDYLKSTDDPEKLTKLKEFNEKGKVRAGTGFVFDSSSVSHLIPQITDAMKPYGNIGAYGSVDIDYDAEMEKYNAALEKTPIKQIQEEMQKQYDEFLKSHK